MQKTTYNLDEVLAEIKRHKGLPENLSTEAQLWDEVFKKMAFKMPQIFLPLIKEVHGKVYKNDVKIKPLATEFIVDKADDTTINTIRADITIIVEDRDIYHFECQIRKDGTMALRMIEYDINIALSYGYFDDDGNSHLTFPSSAVVYLQGQNNIPDELVCTLHFQDGTSYKYKIPTIKVQTYSLEDIREKHLSVLIPFLPLRFRRKNIDKGDLATFFNDIVIILDKEVKDGYLTENNRSTIMELLGKSMIRVFYKSKNLFPEVRRMTEPILKLDSEILEEQVTERVTKELQELYKNDFINLWQEGMLSEENARIMLKKRCNVDESELDEIFSGKGYAN